jgi:hypothetical protein
MRALAIAAFLAGSAVLFSPTATHAQAAGTSSQVKAVVELFTSQGCSSCPAADALLGRLAKRDDIIAISLPVDYWDYLGWPDTLARPEFTARQKAYAKVLGDGMVYTPQAVINGLAGVNGSNENRVDQAIGATSAVFAAARVPVRLSVDSGKLVVGIDPAPNGAPAREATVWLVAIASSVKVPITKGENRGRTIVYSNVVRGLLPIGTWTGKAMTVQLDLQSFRHGATDRCAVFVQQGHAGPIIGAALLPQL